MTTVLTPTEAGSAYARWITKTGLADTTKALYPQHVDRFLTWLATVQDEHDGALADGHARNYAVRDYRHKLLAVDKLAPATVELAMSAIGSFYAWTGLGRPEVKRTPPPKSAPKALDATELRRVMRAAERRGPRDHAIAGLLFFCGIRVSEAAALDTDDVLVSDRSGVVHVRYGKGGESRQVPLSADGRAAVRPWLAHRRALTDVTVGPLFLSRTGGRLSKRRIQSLMTELGEEAGVHLSPHVLRHTLARSFLDSGGDLASLQEVLGHKNLSSTQVYTRPSASRLAELVDRVHVEL